MKISRVICQFSQNFRSINFSDMQIINPNFQINPNIKDERGYNIDLGVRTQSAKVILFDFSLFHLFYNNRIGTVWVTQNNVSSFPGINSSAPTFKLGQMCQNLKHLELNYLQKSIGLN